MKLKKLIPAAVMTSVVAVAFFVYKMVMITFLLSMYSSVQESSVEFEGQRARYTSCEMFWQLVKGNDLKLKTGYCIDIEGSKIIQFGVDHNQMEEAYHKHIAKVAEYEYFVNNAHVSLLKILLMTEYRPKETLKYQWNFYRECLDSKGNKITVYHMYPHALWTENGYLFIPEALEVVKRCKEVKD